MARIIGIQFEKNGKMYYFDPEDLEPALGTYVIVDTVRGADLAEVIMEAREIEDTGLSQIRKVIRIATEQDFNNGVEALIAQCSGLFEQQTVGLTSYQLNFIRALCDGIHSDFGSKTVLTNYNLGTKSNIARIKNSLLDREMIYSTKDGTFLEDPVFHRWFRRNMME